MSRMPSDQKSLFLAALEIETTAGRVQFLNDACGDDDALKMEIESMLDAHDHPPSFMAEMDRLQPALQQPSSASCGTQIGPYKLREQLGEGGMGVVYVAEQSEPVKRRVALKVIKPGMATKDVVARFEAERQALAMMDHPNIARVHDGGVTDSGQTYFVMELVPGDSVTQYCNEHRFSTEDRLRLFVAICKAVHHAHQKGIIHRDLKPSNIIVAEIDGVAVPKVIDFGVAKAVNQSLTEKTFYTQFTQMVGTPLYMSPEQAGIGDIDIDTRSDVYSLGVLLYELLTGLTPFDSDTMKQAGFDEMRRLIREDEPPRPSERVSTLNAEALSTVANERASHARHLSNSLKGELDWIAMKALEKDRNRRYESANDLALDVQRFLENEPVEACPPSVNYRVRKFVRRNAGVLTAVTIVLLCLIGGVIGTGMGMVQARQQRDAARMARLDEKEQREKAEENAQRAEQNAQRADANARDARQAAEAEKAILEFVQKRIFAVARPIGHDGGLGYDTTIRQAIETALPYVESSFQDQPLVKARLLATIGISFNYLGEYEIAEKLMKNALTVLSDQLGPDDPNTIKMMHQLAHNYDCSGRYDEALQLRQAVYDRQNALLGPESTETARALAGLGKSFACLKRYEEAKEQYEKALDLLPKLPTDARDDLPGTSDISNLGEAEQFQLKMVIMANLAATYRNLGQPEDAFRFHEKSYELAQSILGPEHPDTLGIKHELAHTLQSMGRYEDAHTMLQETWEQQERKLGQNHPSTLKTQHCLAKSHSKFARYEAARQIHEAILKHRQDKLGPDHRETLSSEYDLAIAYFGLKQFEKSLALHKEVLEKRRATFGEDDRQTMASLHEVAISSSALGDHEDAITSLEELLVLFQTKYKPDDKNVLGITANLALTCMQANQFKEAAGYASKMNNLWKQRYGSTDADPSRLLFLNDMAIRLSTVADQDMRTLAKELAQDAVDALPNQYPFWHTLALSQVRMGDFDEAIESIHRAREIHDGKGWDWFVLAIAEAGRGNADAGRHWYDKAVEWMNANESQGRKLERLNMTARGLQAEAREALGMNKSSAATPKSDDQPSNVTEQSNQTNNHRETVEPD